MADLIRTNRGKKKNPLSRGEDIKPENIVTIDSIERQANGSSTKTNKNINADRVTFDITARINNHIRNKYSALMGIGVGDSMKDAMEVLLDYYIEGLPDDQARMVKTQLDILERRDVNKHNNSK